MKRSPQKSPSAAVLPRVFALAVIALLALALGGCNKDVATIEAKEGGRALLGNLFYQVQMSRMLNPRDVEDGYYLEGQPTPAKGESYFGVFMRVDNETNATRLVPVGIDKMRIVTAGDKVFRPIVVKGPGWAYAPAPIGRGAHLPIPNTPAAQGPTGGGLILFRIPYADLDDRPLRLLIKSSDGKTGEITLDV